MSFQKIAIIAIISILWTHAQTSPVHAYQTMLQTNSSTSSLDSEVLKLFKSSIELINIKKRMKRNHGQNEGAFSEEDVFDPGRVGALVCKLCVVVDETFVKVNKLTDSAAVISFISKIIDRVSWIFRNVDWNDDGAADNIGFEIISLVKGWNPFPYEEFPAYEVKRPATELLGHFARLDFRSCCLGVGFTNRQFENDQVGVSFIASKTLLGGICDYRLPAPPLLSPNVALISGRGLKGTQLSSNDLAMVLLHELGHTFGVLKHDIDIDDPACSGYDQDEILPTDYKASKVNPPQGRFVMWGQDVQGHTNLKANNLNFSPCSRATVTEILTSGQGRASCFALNQSTFCGNGIVEYPEECDCGNEVSCAKDGCCGPRGSSGPCQLFKGINLKTCRLALGQNKNDTKKGKKNGARLVFSDISKLLMYLLFFILGTYCI